MNGNDDVQLRLTPEEAENLRFRIKSLERDVAILENRLADSMRQNDVLVRQVKQVCGSDEIRSAEIVLLGQARVQLGIQCSERLLAKIDSGITRRDLDDAIRSIASDYVDAMRVIDSMYAARKGP